MTILYVLYMYANRRKTVMLKAQEETESGNAKTNLSLKQYASYLLKLMGHMYDNLPFRSNPNILISTFS